MTAGRGAFNRQRRAWRRAHFNEVALIPKYIFFKSMSAQLKRQTEQPTQDQRLRFCPMCDAMIPISEFGVNRQAKDGLNRYCRPHIRQKVYEFRQRVKGFKAAEWERKQKSLRASECAVNGRDWKPATTTIDIVFDYLERHGEATQKQIHNATAISIAEIDIALTELLITRRAIGTRVLTEHTRIYFRL